MGSPGILRGASRAELRGTEPAVAQEARKVGSFRAARGTKVCSPPRLPPARSRCRWSGSGQWVWRTHWIPGVGAPGDLEGSLGLGSAAPSLRSLRRLRVCRIALANVLDARGLENRARRRRVQDARSLRIWSSLRFKATEGERAPDWISDETLGISTMRSAG